jgi:hypothetical protein
VIRYQQPVALYFKELLGWDNKRLEEELNQLRKLVDDVTEFKHHD